MKQTLLAVLVLMALQMLSLPTQADSFQLTAHTSLVSGQPNGIYEVNPGQSASVTITSSSNYTCKNISGATKTAYLTWTPLVYLRKLSNNQTVLTTSDGRQTTAVLANNATWSLTGDTLTTTGTMPIEEYRCHALTNLFEDKTGEVDQDNDAPTRDVSVRPYA